MRNLSELNRHRVPHPFTDELCDDESGVFLLPMDGETVCVVASVCEGWEHVSVSLDDRRPTWAEMEDVKQMFFDVDETVIQIHTPGDYVISFGENCLHLWRPTDGNVPLPPKWMVT